MSQGQAMTKAQVQRLLRRFVVATKKAYGKRLGFVIHHGSWATGEAKLDSDIDALVMLDEVTSKELDDMRTILSRDEFKAMTVLLFSRRDIDQYPPLPVISFTMGPDCCSASVPFRSRPKTTC